MDYPELSGATISERDKAFAQEFANFVNGSMCSPDQTGRELTKAHRYLQQQMFKVFLGFMKQLAHNYQQGTDQSSPLPATADVQGVPRLHEAAGTQLSAGN